ncbi:endonuclease/exonuclease/phosphatase family protein [Geodermatophilus normandii]|uniref:Endonuclease/exonuclease/phosphatase family protein n=1 Tax=Geodermatophilus normandii TaxID=1137989 RepID=A0A317QQZ0_9ACTN|nr:endonuclease/exonuclease/phosphatase family protein [Geodermatophilus normandii]PWW25056.1 endonuclease/exonuclease/phosphatase family protein [Geodermatophilus normandii]
MDVEIGTFNLLNLARPGERYYPDERPYSQAEYEQKATWIAHQLRLMDADLVGLQEVFHEEALRDVCDRSGQYDDGTVVAPGADGASGPRLGLASRLPLDGPVTAVTDFPPGIDVAVEDVGLPAGTFSRPVLRARVVLDPAKDTTATVLVAHLKSKRPIRDPQAPEHDPREEALGKARALVRRAAEAAALRFLVLDEVVGTSQPVIVLGDLNDAARAVTTDVIMGDAPSRFWPSDPEDRRAYWDRLLYSAYELTVRRTGRDVSYTHIFNGHYENLDHILVSQEFYERNPQRIAEVRYLRYLNDHLVDSQLSNDRRDRVASDHAQLVAEIRLL